MATRTDRNLFLGLFLLALLLAAGMFAVGLQNIPASTDESIIALQARYIFTPPADPAVRASLQPQPLWGRFPLLFMAQPYLFPIEAYLAAVPQLLLPPGAFGARAVPFALSLATLVFSFLVLRNFGPARKVWPGLLLLAVPSAYVLMMQFGYALPSYPSHLFFTALAVWLFQRYTARPSAGRACACGLVCAAALAGQFMAAPLVLLCGGLILAVGPGWRRMAHAAGFGFLSLGGMAPIWLARRLYPGAHAAVAGRWPWREALDRLWAPALNFVLPVVSGIKTTVFPDNTRHIEICPGLTAAWPFLWLGTMLLAGLLLAVRVWKKRGRLEKDAKAAAAVFLGLPAAAILLFVFSRRSHSHTYRYLIHAAWCLPFVVGFSYSEAPWRWLRRILGTAAVALAVFNGLVIGHLVKEWKTPDFAAEEASLYDTGPALAYLENEAFHRVYAGYHLAYRLTYLSDERVIAGQPFNERFYGWPLPYSSAVDAADRIAYVLAPRFALPADQFAADMEKMGVLMQTAAAGALTVFHGFEWPGAEQQDWLSPPGLRAETSHNPGAAYALINGVYGYRWRSLHTQAPGMWAELRWDAPIRLHQVYLYYNYYRHDQARALDVYVLEEGAWRRVRSGVQARLDAHEFERGRPVYGNQFQRIEVEPTRAEGLRIVLAEADPHRNWAIGEIRLWGARE